VFFFKSKAAKKPKPAPKKKTPLTEAQRERASILTMIRGMRKRISPDVLLSAERAAFIQLGEVPPEPAENEASRLFKMAMKNNGARRGEILELVERRVNKRLH
jgi:hypothetical protein